MGGSTELEPITEEDRSRVKKELSQSLTAAEAKKQRAAQIKKKLQEDYAKQRDPIKEFFTLVSYKQFYLYQVRFISVVSLFLDKLIC